DIDTGKFQEKFARGFCTRLLRRVLSEDFSYPHKALFLDAVGEKPERTDTHEPLRQDMQKKAPDEFFGLKGHLSADIIVAVPVAEGDVLVINMQNAVVGDSHAVSISPEVVQDLFRSGKWRLGIDHPFLRTQRPDQPCEPFGSTENLSLAGIYEPVRTSCLFEQSDKFPSEYLRESFHGEEIWFCAAFGYPGLAILSKDSTWHHTVDMEMIQEDLAPGMQNCEKSQSAAQIVAAERQECLAHSRKQHIQHDRLVGKYERIKIMWQGKDRVKVLRRQELSQSCLQPACLGQCLALWTMPVATGMVDLPGETAGIAALYKTAQLRCAACHDGVHDFDMLPGHVVCLPIGLAMHPEDVGHLPGWSM